MGTFGCTAGGGAIRTAAAGYVFSVTYIAVKGKVKTLPTVKSVKSP